MAEFQQDAYANGGPIMTKKAIVDLCNKHDLYRTPAVNDKLYLHSQGFRRIDPEVMGLYTGLRCLWLQQNGLAAIEGLEKCVELRNLCLHENCIDEMRGMDTLVDLDSLNISRNFLKKIEGLGKCQKLTNLNVGQNSIGPDVDAIESVLEIPGLQTLDLQGNRLEDGEAVLGVLKKMPQLRVVYCQGNPFVKDLRHYRKRLISECPQLRYLDDRPVFEDERRRATAWAAKLPEGLDAANEAERAEIAQIRADKKAAEEKRVRDFEAFIANARATKAATDANKGLTFSGERVTDPLADENADPNAPPPPPPAFVDVDELD